MKVVLDFKNILDKIMMHQYLKEKLEFPDYYGNNLDALYDMLTSLEEGTFIEIINYQNFEKNDEKYFKSLCELFEDVNNEDLGVKIILKK